MTTLGVASIQDIETNTCWFTIQPPGSVALTHNHNKAESIFNTTIGLCGSTIQLPRSLDLPHN